MSNDLTDNVSNQSLDKAFDRAPSNEPSTAVTPKTPQDGTSLAAGTRDIPSSHTKSAIKSTGLPTVQEKPALNTDTTHTGVVATSHTAQSPISENGLSPTSEADYHSAEEIGSSVEDIDASLLGAARILADISSNPRNRIPSPPWLLSRFEDDRSTVYTEDDLPGESEFSSDVGAEGDDSEDDSPSGSASTPAFQVAIPASDRVHSQPSAQGVTTSGDQIWLPFPDNRDVLVDYLERGLSLRRLFPMRGSQEEGRIVCMARLVLIGGVWKHTSDVCSAIESTLESYQRHIKSAHLRVTRSPNASLALPNIVESWNYKDRTLKRLDKKLWVRPWNRATQLFPLVDEGDLETEQK